jgi:hypothetical protein
MVQDSARSMGNELIDDLNDAYRTNATFHSTFIHSADETNLLLETSGVISGRGSVSATYVADKQATDYLFTDLAGMLFPIEIRESGGFYDISKKLSKQDNSNISIAIIPGKDENFFVFKVTQEIKDVEIDVERIDFLELFDMEKMTRSDYFDGKIVPLNSVIQLIILPEEDKQVKALSTNVITDLTKLENILKKGWFISSPAGEIIDLRFLFGESKTVMADELIVKTAPMDTNSEMTNYSVEDVVDKPEDSTQYIVLGIIIAVGIGATIFYLKGYRPKH